MEQDKLRISDHLLVESNEDGLVLKSREEVGRGKRFGMSGEMELSEHEAEQLAKWVFVRNLG